MAYDIPAVSVAMDQKINQLDHIANNLANSGTAGFKAQHLHALQTMAEDVNTNGNNLSDNVLFTDFSQGIIQKTGNPLDLALQDDGFFVVQTPEGQAFSRKGDFTVNKLGQLVTQAGNPVIGDGGAAITLKDGKIHVSDEGVFYVDGNQVGKLRIVDFSNRQALENTGGGLYRDPGTAGLKQIEKSKISSGFIELSNVNIIKEMAEMIDIQRSFETYQKVIQTLADDDKLSVGRIGRVA